MSVFTSVGILLFSMLIMASLQFVPGGFALFYHNLAGKFVSHRTFHTALFFILGAEVAFTFFALASYLLINTGFAFLPFLNTTLITWVSAGILLGYAVLSYLLYFRKGTGTKLFISRNFISKYLASLSTTKTRANAFLLGASSVLPELVFSLPIFLVTSISIMNIGTSPIARALLFFIFIFCCILPLLIIYTLFNQNSTLADFIRFRFKNKTFFRVLISLSYLVIAILIILGATIWA